MNKTTNTEHELDALLRSRTVSAPANFSDQVVQRITPQTGTAPQALMTIRSTSANTPLWQWLALGTASIAGFIQVTGFVFGVWAATAAG